MKKIIGATVVLLLLTLSACVRQATYAPYPILTDLTVDRTSVGETFIPANGADSVLVSLSFTDGEGGIGPVPLQSGVDSLGFIPCTNHAYDSAIIADPNFNVFWYEYHASHISTDSCLDKLATPYIPDNSKNPSIKGIIQVYAPIECPPTGNVDTLYFSYFIKDRKGKISNRMRTPPIIVTCQ